MPKYQVSYPLCGYAYGEVEAESEEHAKEVFCDVFDIDDPEFSVEYELFDEPVRGNVYYGSLTEVDVQLVDENDVEQLDDDTEI